jgi:hypothetical protein
MNRVRSKDARRGRGASSTVPRETRVARAADPSDRAPSTPPAPGKRPGWTWLVTGPLALIALLAACRGALLGVPVTDDYTFLAALRFHPLDLLGPMGSPLYWRPLSRQIYFWALGPLLVTRPWIAVALHLVLLLALFLVLDRIARRFLDPPLAAVVAIFPLLGEPTRVLLAWPSGGEYLLAMLGVALATHEALAGRRWTAALAALAAILSHEAATLILFLLPSIAWLRTRRAREAMMWTAISGALASVSILGHAAARARGMSLPVSGAGFSWRLWPALIARALAAQLDLEELSGLPRAILIAAWITIAVAAVFLATRRDARARLARWKHVLIGAALWFVLAVAPLTALLPDWNGWRTVFPALGLALALIGTLALIAPPLAVAATGLRLIGLCLAPLAPVLIAGDPPASSSQMSFVRLARLERAVESTRRALLARHARLEPHADVRYWGLPQLCEYGFEGSKAVRVWYRDSTIQWTGFGGDSGLTSRIDALVTYDENDPWPARVVEPEALRLLRDGRAALLGHRLAESDSLLTLARRISPTRGLMPYTLLISSAYAAYQGKDYARADSLARAALDVHKETPDFWALEARIAIARDDPRAAAMAVQRCLRLDPSHADGRRIASMIGER